MVTASIPYVMVRIVNPCIIVRSAKSSVTHCYILTSSDLSRWIKHASVRIQSNLLLMTCQVLIQSPQGAMPVGALLDSGSAVSFVPRELLKLVALHRTSRCVE